MIAAPAQAGTIGIAIFQGSADTQERVQHAAADAALRAGHDVILRNANGSLEAYHQILNELIDQRVDAMVLGMGKPQETAGELERAQRQGIPVVTITTGYSPYVPLQLDANHYNVGADSALYLMETLGHSGDMATIRYEKNAGSRMRGRTLDAVIAEEAGVREVASHTMTDTHDWKRDVRRGATDIMENHSGTLRAMWVSFDGQAVVVDDLLQEHGIGRDRLGIVTVDGSQDVYRRIASPKSTIIATFAIPFEAMAQEAVSHIDLWLSGKELPAKPTTVYFDAPMVDASNVTTFLRP